MARRTFAGLVAGCALVAALSPGRADAQTCDTRNLLAGKRPWQWQDLKGDAALVTDGAIGPEGTQWDAPIGIILDTGAGSLTYDLGEPTPISGVYLQADANDTYKIMGSPDGTPGSFKLLVEIDNASDRGHGLRGRSMQFAPVTVRYLRVGEGVGDGFYSISEFSAYCQAPYPFPPSMKVADAPQAVVNEPPWYKFEWWQDKPSARFEMGLAAFAFLLLYWGWRVAKAGKETVLPPWAETAIMGLSLVVHVSFFYMAGPRFIPGDTVKPISTFTLVLIGIGTWCLSLLVKTVRDRMLVLVGVLSFFAYFNFGKFHFGNYIHFWDTYHYYVGTKYFKELSYDRLYECASVADSEEPSLRRRVELRKIMNLRTNVLGSTTEILAHPENCKGHFTPERWQKFKKDIEFFRVRQGVKRWEEAQTDHGYNATPVWNILGTTLANMAPASINQMWALTLIDPLFIFGMAGMIWWAFGWRTLCVALAVFATNFPSRFYWTGGAYLRWDWLFHMTAGVCLAKKGRYVLGGFLMAYAGLLRVFPMFLLVGPVFVLIQQILDYRKHHKSAPEGSKPLPQYLGGLIRSLDRGHRNVVLGGVLAIATLVPISIVVGGGPGCYKAFVQNSKKHTSTALTNYMGWRTVATFKFDEASYVLRTDRLEDPWKDWKDARLRTYHQRKWFYVVGVLGFAALLYGAVRKRTPWEAAALSGILIAAIPELTCYYYSFLIVMALLWSRRAEAGMALLAITAGTGFADMAPTQYLPSQGLFWSRINHLMPTWLAEQYTLMSAITLAGLVYILYEFGFSQRATLAPVPVWETEPASGGAAPASKAGEKAATTDKGASAASPSRASATSNRSKKKKKR
jgi:hypothetical protein